jgi:tRNA nucleotidyltransferase (CCA-adding enzyme)
MRLATGSAMPNMQMAGHYVLGNMQGFSSFVSELLPVRFGGLSSVAQEILSARWS